MTKKIDRQGRRNESMTLKREIDRQRERKAENMT